MIELLLSKGVDQAVHFSLLSYIIDDRHPDSMFHCDQRCYCDLQKKNEIILNLISLKRCFCILKNNTYLKPSLTLRRHVILGPDFTHISQLSETFVLVSVVLQCIIRNVL